jgi:hypothetical protein
LTADIGFQRCRKYALDDERSMKRKAPDFSSLRQEGAALLAVMMAAAP